MVGDSSGLGLGAYVHFPSQHWDPLWLRPEQALCMLRPFLRVRMCVGPACLEGLVFLVFTIPSASQNLSDSSCMGFPEPWGDEFDRFIPFRTSCSKVSPSLHTVHLWVFVFVLILQEGVSLRKAEQDTDLRVQQNVLSGHFVALLLWQNRSLRCL